MTALACTIQEGLMPTEKIARIQTADGEAELVAVWVGNIKDGKLMVFEIGRREGRVLVELPRESASGRWRIWVNQSSIGG